MAAETQPLRATFPCYCQFCLNPLYIGITHADLSLLSFYNIALGLREDNLDEMPEQ